MKKKGKSVLRKRDDKNATFKGIMDSPKIRFGMRHVLQAIVGATLLAVPVGFTQETWDLGSELPMWNVILILIASLFFVYIFAYRNFSKNAPGFYWVDLFKRVFVIYLLSFIIVALLLTVILKAPWTTDWVLALKRTIIVSFPCSLSATIAGNLK